MFRKKNKKWCLAFFFLPLFIYAGSALYADTRFGDVNNNGTVNVVDALMTAQYSVGISLSQFDREAADVSGDNKVSIVDALMIAQYTVGLIAEFPAEGDVINTPWDWAGVIGTGQSLAVGEQGKPVQSTTQPYGNLKLETGSLSWPVDPANSTLRMVPLVEPVSRMAPNYPSSWPANMAGETPHSSMANQISAMVREKLNRDYTTVHGNVGENGQCMIYLAKDAPHNGVNGRAYEATLVEVEAVKRLAAQAGKSYGVAAVSIVHGECDSGNTNYENELHKLWADYNSDIKAITGQEQDLQLFVSQQNSQGDNSASTLAQWKAGVDYPVHIVCTGPKYQYPYARDNVHLITEGYRMLGEKFAQIYYERIIMGHNWQPLQPTGIEVNGNVITVRFHVPAPPLAWENTFQTPLQQISEWQAGKGFEVNHINNTRLRIESVTIEEDSVRITCAENLPSEGFTVSYALTASSGAMNSPFTGTRRWGLLRDSDPFVGDITGRRQPNYCVAFRMTVR